MDKERLKTSILFSISVVAVIMLTGFVRNLLSTKSTVTINTAEEKIISEGLYSYYPGRWYFSDKIIVASGSSIDFSVTFVSISYPSATLDLFPTFKFGLIDVTDDESNQNIEELQDFSVKIDAHLATQKGRKYKLVLYSSQPLKEKEIKIDITGCDKIRTYFCNRENQTQD